MKTQQLKPWDASFLFQESRVYPMNICSVAHFSAGPDGSALTLGEVRSAVLRALPELPPFHHRVVRAPFGLGKPRWAEDPNLNVDDHLHEVTLPAPGNPKQLAEQVSLIAARPLDLTRPLWEIYLINGLESGEVVMILKFHHAAVDGGSAGRVMPILLDRAPDSPRAEPRDLPQPGPLPGSAEMLRHGLVDAAGYPLDVMRVAKQMMSRLPHMLGLVRAVGAEANPFAPADANGIRQRDWQPPMFGAPSAPFNGQPTQNRCWAFGQVPLEDIKAIKNTFGGTVNDVVLAVCAGALRQWLLDQGALPRENLGGMIPVSVRADGDHGTFGNEVSMMTCTLPTTVADPVQRLRATSAATAAAKRMHAAMGGDFMSNAMQLALPMMGTPPAKVAVEMPMPPMPRYPANLYISNVPGPPGPLYLAGKQMLTFYPAAFLSRTMGLNMVVLSYVGNLNFGLMGCPDLVTDIDGLMDHVVGAVNELIKAAKAAA